MHNYNGNRFCRRCVLYPSSWGDAWIHINIQRQSGASAGARGASSVSLNPNSMNIDRTWEMKTRRILVNSDLVWKWRAHMQDRIYPTYMWSVRCMTQCRTLQSVSCPKGAYSWIKCEVGVAVLRIGVLVPIDAEGFSGVLIPLTLNQVALELRG